MHISPLLRQFSGQDFFNSHINIFTIFISFHFIFYLTNKVVYFTRYGINYINK